MEKEDRRKRGAPMTGAPQSLYPDTATHFGNILRDEAKRLRALADQLDPDTRVPAQDAPEPSDEDWNIRKYIDFLRADEGDSVTLLCDNPDFNGQPNCAIECNGYWTNWQDRRFAADTLQGALELAYFECREWRANPPPEVSPDPLPAYADQNFKYDMETGTYRRISGVSALPSTSQNTPERNNRFCKNDDCPYPDCLVDGVCPSQPLPSTDPRCTCGVIVNPNIPHARSCPLSSTSSKPHCIHGLGDSSICQDCREQK